MAFYSPFDGDLGDYSGVGINIITVSLESDPWLQSDRNGGIGFDSIEGSFTVDTIRRFYHCVLYSSDSHRTSNFVLLVLPLPSRTPAPKRTEINQRFVYFAR